MRHYRYPYGLFGLTRTYRAHGHTVHIRNPIGCKVAELHTYLNRLLHVSGLREHRVDLTSFEVDGIDHRDYPDFCDAYIASALWDDGTELSEDELEALNEDSDLVYDAVQEKLY